MLGDVKRSLQTMNAHTIVTAIKGKFNNYLPTKLFSGTSQNIFISIKSSRNLKLEYPI